MNIALLLMTDGRTAYIHQTVESSETMLKGPIIERWMHDDSGNEEHRQWLHSQFPTFTHIGEGPRKGFGGAYNFAWKTLATKSEASFIFNLEDDFTFNQEVPLEAMAEALDKNPSLYQMALRRQAWGQEEIKAGGVIERWPHNFQQEDGWISHRMWFTTNPNLCRKSLIETRQFPAGKDSEGHFHHLIIKSDPNAIYGYWGQKTDPAWVEHIGRIRGEGTY